MARVHHQRLRFGWASELKRLAASGDTAAVEDLVDYIKGQVDQIGVFDQMWNGVITGAISRSLPVEITKGQALQLYREQGGQCALSGEPIDFRPGGFGAGRRSGTASLDRINSEYGYLPDNVWWVHRDVNRMKWNLSLDRFLDLAQAIADRAGAVRLRRPAVISDMVPKFATDTTDAVRLVSLFIRDCAEDDDNHEEMSGALWLRFEAWRSETRSPSCSRTMFGRALTALGYRSIHGHLIRRHGLRLKPAVDAPGSLAQDGNDPPQ